MDSGLAEQTPARGRRILPAPGQWLHRLPDLTADLCRCPLALASMPVYEGLGLVKMLMVLPLLTELRLNQDLLL